MRKSTLFIAALFVLLTSCQSVDKKKVKETVESFFSAYRGEDVKTATDIYPDLQSLCGQFRKSTSIDLNTDDIIVVNDTNIIVKLTHHWVNPFGADNSTNMRLYLAKEGSQYKIRDSKNFCSFENMPIYRFGCKTGAINLSRDTTDRQISAALILTSPMFQNAKERIKSDITNGLTISSLNWQRGYYGDYASGRAIVTNNTNYPIKRPQYTVTYSQGENGTVITSDNGTVCYDVLMPGQSKSFSWYTPYVGNATWANVMAECTDDEWIEEILNNLP